MVAEHDSYHGQFSSRRRVQGDAFLMSVTGQRRNLLELRIPLSSHRRSPCRRSKIVLPLSRNEREHLCRLIRSWEQSTPSSAAGLAISTTRTAAKPWSMYGATLKNGCGRTCASATRSGTGRRVLPDLAIRLCTRTTACTKCRRQQAGRRRMP